jgi:hypothetical protein
MGAFLRRCPIQDWYDPFSYAGSAICGEPMTSSMPFLTAQGEKNHPRKIACYSRLFRDHLAEIDGWAQSHASAIFRNLWPKENTE